MSEDENVSLPDPEHLQAELAAVIENMVYSGTPEEVAYRFPYLWAGVTPDGMDCSGAVCWAWTQVSTPAGVKALGRPNTDVLWEKLAHVDSGSERPGDLAIYGSADPKDPACHVMVLIGNGRVAGMTGGGHKNTAVALSRASGAGLHVRRDHLYRPDFIGWRRLPWSEALKGATP